MKRSVSTSGRKLWILLFLFVFLGCKEGDSGNSVSQSPDLSAMVEIEGSAYEMGHPKGTQEPYGSPWMVNELPPHTVELAGFAMDRTEVTVGDWALFLQEVGGQVHHHPLQPVAWLDGEVDALPDEKDRPVRQVSWFDAAVYCAWAGKRLPTEAEWERGAKSNLQNMQYPWGSRNPTCDLAVFYTGVSLCEKKPAPVGSRSPEGNSPDGLVDMAGNVAEWVMDWYGAYEEGNLSNPLGPDSGDLKVVRGGGFRDSGTSISTTTRWGARAGDRSEGVGFRCAVSL